MTINKTRCVKMALSTIRHDGTRKVERMSPSTTPTIWTEHEDLGKGIKWLQEAIWRGSLRLRELDEEWTWLRRKSMMLDEEIRKLKIGVVQPS